MNTEKWGLRPMGFGLAIGVISGIYMFVLGLLAHYGVYGESFVTTMGTIYVGYAATIVGSLVGGIMGFVDGFIKGALIAWLYNMFSHCPACGPKGKKKD